MTYQDRERVGYTWDSYASLGGWYCYLHKTTDQHGLDMIRLTLCNRPPDHTPELD